MAEIANATLLTEINKNAFPAEEEIIDLDECSSDLEVIAISKSIIEKKRKKIKKLQKIRSKVYINSENNLILNEQDSYIKEEIIISDGSNSGDELSNNSNPLQYNRNHNCINKLNRKLKKNESLSSIELNCPKCNKTEKVFSVTITTECEDCNVSMFYVCDQCSCRFRTMAALYRHKKLQCKSNKIKNKDSKKSRFYCVRCASCKSIEKSYNLRNLGRCKLCKKAMKFVCNICDKNYESYSGMYKHNKSQCQSDFKLFYCNDCDFNTYNQSFLLAHMKQQHPECYRLDLSCKKCGRKFCDKAAKTYHETSVCGVAIIQCKFCSKQCQNLDEVKEHLINIHSEKLRHKTADTVVTEIFNEFNVTNCSAETQNKVVQNKFVITDIKQSYCPGCNIFYDYSHKRCCSSCNTELRYQCNFCSKMSSRPSLLIRHFYRQHGKHVYPCKTCGRKFSFQGDANSHMKVCGVGPNYACKICFFKTRYRYNMKKHMLRIHNKTFSCERCDRNFESDESLKQHIQFCFYAQDMIN